MLDINIFIISLADSTGFISSFRKEVENKTNNKNKSFMFQSKFERENDKNTVASLEEISIT